MAIFYRAVSLKELADIRKSGRLRTTAGSCKGKHLATSLMHARQWGRMLNRPQSFAVVRVSIDDAIAANFVSWNRLDGIGPASFATIDQIDGFSIDEVFE